MSFRTFITQKLGVDKAIFFTLIGKMLQMSTAFFSVLFIAKFLSPNQQGYYYTFGSIVAIQVFFELGLTGIITQFVAHEASHLQISQLAINGDTVYQSRLASLLKICFKWYVIISIVLFIVLSIVGFLFFSFFNNNSADIQWRGPWLLLVFGTVVNFLTTPLVAIVEGLGYVKEIAKFRMVQQISQPIALWGGLWLGADLYVSGLDVACRSLIMLFLIVKSPIFQILKKIWSVNIKEIVSYRNEIFPYQWRIAVSWISGYFIFQLFNPVLFATEGPEIAGQMGMTMQALNALLALTLAWISTKVPKISGLIALKAYSNLDQLFGKTFKQVVGIGFVIVVFFVGSIIVVQDFNIRVFSIDIGNRFLPKIPLLLMSWSVFTMFPINCWAIYLRSHKKEPLMVNSVVMGLLCCMSTITLGNLFGLNGIVYSFAILRFVSLGWIYYVYRTKKVEWHQNKKEDRQ